MTRERLDAQLAQHRNDVLFIGSMVEQATLAAVDALKRRDVAAAKRIYADDEKINRKRFETESAALITIATQQPMAHDLRILGHDFEARATEPELHTRLTMPAPEAWLDDSGDDDRPTLRVGELSTRAEDEIEALESADLPVRLRVEFDATDNTATELQPSTTETTPPPFREQRRTPTSLLLAAAALFCVGVAALYGGRFSPDAETASASQTSDLEVP
jgi:hypothetical protein